MFIGVRISWLMFATNSDFTRTASSASSRAAARSLSARRRSVMSRIVAVNVGSSPPGAAIAISAGNSSPSARIAMTSIRRPISVPVPVATWRASPSVCAAREIGGTMVSASVRPITSSHR